MTKLKDALNNYVLAPIYIAGWFVAFIATDIKYNEIPASFWRMRNTSRCGCLKSVVVPKASHECSIDCNQNKPIISLRPIASQPMIDTRASLLRLPKELRDMIYQHCVPTATSVSLGYVECDLQKAVRWQAYSKHGYRPPVAFMATCKQVHQETATMFYGTNHFHIEIAVHCTPPPSEPQKLDSQHFPRLPMAPVHPAYCKAVRNMHISMITPKQLCPTHTTCFFANMVLRLLDVECAYVRLSSSGGYKIGWQMDPSPATSGVWKGSRVYVAAQSGDVWSCFASQLGEQHRVDGAAILALSSTKTPTAVEIWALEPSQLEREMGKKPAVVFVWARFSRANVARSSTDARGVDDGSQY